MGFLSTLFYNLQGENKLSYVMVLREEMQQLGIFVNIQVIHNYTQTPDSELDR